MRIRDNLDIIILGVVSQQGPLYGLEITRAVKEVAGDAIKLSAGSLYPSLHKLALKGWLEGETKTPPQGGAPVTYYRITAEGRKALSARRAEVKKFNKLLEGLIGSFRVNGRTL